LSLKTESAPKESSDAYVGVHSCLQMSRRYVTNLFMVE
jgi:hypothetical protein